MSPVPGRSRCWNAAWSACYWAASLGDRDRERRAGLARNWRVDVAGMKSPDGGPCRWSRRRTSATWGDLRHTAAGPPAACAEENRLRFPGDLIHTACRTETGDRGGGAGRLRPRQRRRHRTAGQGDHPHRVRHRDKTPMDQGLKNTVTDHGATVGIKVEVETRPRRHRVRPAAQDRGRGADERGLDTPPQAGARPRAPARLGRVEDVLGREPRGSRKTEGSSA